MSTFDPDLTIIGAIPGESTEDQDLLTQKQANAKPKVESVDSESSEPQRAIELVQGSRPKLDDETQGPVAPAFASCRCRLVCGGVRILDP